jgi:hypothetical protein
MIVAERKSLADIKSFIAGFERVLVVGCGTCATVCLAGGESEVGVVGLALRIAARADGRRQEVLEDCVTRQCEPEFVEAVIERVRRQEIDAVVSLGCGVGVNFVAERLGDVPVFPGLDTKFLGASPEPGVWVELCAGCGNCILHLTGGICPIARCSKSLLNGPCGGSNNGKCEISPDVECGWALIVERMKRLGTLDRLTEVLPPRDWSSSAHGGPRRVVREELRQLATEPVEKAAA